MSFGEKFYYCFDCKRFHEIGTHGKVSKKLCFFCGLTKKEKTKIITNSFGEKAQCCKKCCNEVNVF